MHASEIKHSLKNTANEINTVEVRNLVRDHLQWSDFDFVMKNEWSSRQKNHREQIRQFVFQNIYPDHSVLNMDQRPIIPDVGLSISHNAMNGGFIVSDSHEHIGFDIELSQRLHAGNVRRFSVHDAEVLSAPSAAALWTAKEAAFKSLSADHQPAVIGEIEIGDWVQLDSHLVTSLFTCRIVAVKNKIFNGSKGLVLQQGEQTLAFFKILSANNEMAVN